MSRFFVTRRSYERSNHSAITSLFRRTLQRQSYRRRSIYQARRRGWGSCRGLKWSFWTKRRVQDSNEELAKELADIIHYTVAIAAINEIDLTKTIFEKDKTAAVKYQRQKDLEQFLAEKSI